MSFGITVTRAIKDAQVVFTAMLNTADEALSTAALLATGAAQVAPTKQATSASTTEKNVAKAETTAKASTEKQTPDASDSSASSSTGSKQASDAGAKGKTEDAALDYEKDIKPLVLGIAKISRAKIEALLQRFGVATAKALTADQYAEFKELADKVLAGEYDPTASNDEAIA